MKRIYEFTVNKEAEVTEDTVETKKEIRRTGCRNKAQQTRFKEPPVS